VSTITISVERTGRAEAEVMPDIMAFTFQPFIKRNITVRTTSVLSNKTHNRHSVNHIKGEWTKSDLHINTIETFFTHLERSFRGAFKGISKQHLQVQLTLQVQVHQNKPSAFTSKFFVPISVPDALIPVPPGITFVGSIRSKTAT